MNSSGWNNMSNQTMNGWNNSVNQPNKNKSGNQTTNGWNSLSNNLMNKQSDNSKLSNLEKKINTLEKKVETLSQNSSKRKYLEISHYNITCNNCQKQNINGIRYLCGNCPNGSYSLCYQCIKYAEEIHPTNHFFIRIPDTRVWNQINNIQQQPQYNYNV